MFFLKSNCFIQGFVIFDMSCTYFVKFVLIYFIIYAIVNGIVFLNSFWVCAMLLRGNENIFYIELYHRDFVELI